MDEEKDYYLIGYESGYWHTESDSIPKNHRDEYEEGRADGGLQYLFDMEETESYPEYLDEEE